jgi:hypothetical protein
MIMALILASLACGSIQFGVVTPTTVNEPEPTKIAPEEIIEEVEQPNKASQTQDIPNPTATETPSAHPSAVAVIAWLGHIASLPEGSQFDDMVVLSPEGTGEFGLMGTTPELEAEIHTLRDAQGPNEFAHLWGTLNCNVEDYNQCQLVVDKMQYGANFSEENFKNWRGTIKSHTFNGGDSSVFELPGDFPMWYSIRASQDPEMQTKIENVRDTGAIVEVSGKLLVGIPDVNGTRIEPGYLEVIEVPMINHSEVDITPVSIADWPVFVNERYGYQVQYPPQAIISLYGPESFSAEEKPADMTADQYMDSLLKEYTNQLCVQIEYSLGWIFIAAPPNKERFLTPCGPTGLGAGEIINKIETIPVGDQLFQANGVEFKLQLIDSDGNQYTGETLDLHGEMFGFELEDGTRIRFGSTPRSDATYEDYLMKTKEVLLQIIATYEKQP